MGDADAIVKRRRLQNQYLQEQRRKKEDALAIWEAYGDIDVSFELFMEHDSYDSQLIDAILNYYFVSYKRNQNLLYLYFFKKTHKDELKNIKFPVLKAYFSFEEKQLIQGPQEILNFFLDKNFIFDPKHVTNSAAAIQGVEFATTVLQKNLDTLFWSPILTYENGFKSDPQGWRQNQKSYMIVKAIRLHFQKVFGSVVKNMFKSWTNRKEYKGAKKRFLENLEEWGNRIGNKDFHGGNEPDEADFSVFAVIKTKYNSRSFQRFLERDCPVKVEKWFIRMQIKCKYDPNRVLVLE